MKFIEHAENRLGLLLFRARRDIICTRVICLLSKNGMKMEKF